MSEFATGYQPTEIGILLSEGIYRLYRNRPEIKPALENALLHMARTDAFGFYMAMGYLRAQVFREQRGLSPFRMESGILHEIGRCFALHSKSLKQGITDANGIHYPDALKDILRWNRVTQENYGIQLLPMDAAALSSLTEEP